MKKQKKNPPSNDDSKEKSKTNEKDLIEVEIEKNFFIYSKNHDRTRLDKWKIGRRNFS